MIKVESVRIEEFRGIRKLDLEIRQQCFAIYGANGSGKSGVIDAVEFALTGQIGRLAGAGTSGLSVADHGPHVDKAKSPGAAFVSLRVFLPGLNKYATITRKISSPKKPVIEPGDADIKAALNDLSQHPELTLSRREVLQFILVEPSKRSEAIQALLKLDELGRIRATLNSTRNRLANSAKLAELDHTSVRTRLQQHLQIATLQPVDILAAVNARRHVLQLPPIAELTTDTRFDADLENIPEAMTFNKTAALRDLEAARAHVQLLPELAKAEAEAIVADLKQLGSDPALRRSFQRRTLIEQGLDLLTDPECPLCDTPWSDEKLRQHLKAKLQKSEDARQLRERLLGNGNAIAQAIVKILATWRSVPDLGSAHGAPTLAALVSAWLEDLTDFSSKMSAVDDLTAVSERLTQGWVQAPASLLVELESAIALVYAKPDQTAIVDARTFLSTAQLRLNEYRESLRRNEAASIAATSASRVYETYCEVQDGALDSLYAEVEADFSTYYRFINKDDESKFTAKLTPSEGKVSLDVNFYGRGLYPPAAYHSDGHQDGMGVCLYLALMKRLFGERFSLALLDDVVTSVDTQHRYQFCRLLMTAFPNTQFLITTHDRVWAEQMRSAGLVTAKTLLAFQNWSIDDGPVVESNADVWKDIDASLAKGKIDVAAGSLRRHLEYMSAYLADLLGAQVRYRADGNYELEELLSKVLSRLKELYGKAASAAQSWGDDAAKAAISSLKADLSESAGAKNIEQWAINKAVHYNAWANFGQADFQPVVTAFKALLDSMRCKGCDSWLYVTPRHNPDALRCECGKLTFNLKSKSS